MVNFEAFKASVLALWEWEQTVNPDLSGARNSGLRRAILEKLTGRKCTIAESGTNAVREALLSAAGISEDHCYAERIAQFREHATAIVLENVPNVRLIVRTKIECSGEPRTVVDSYLTEASESQAREECRRADFGIYRHGLSAVAVKRGDVVDFDGREFTLRKVNA